MINHVFLKSLREENNLSQEFAAKKIGVSRPSYIEIEKGQKELTVSQAQKLAELFNISLKNLIAGKKESTAKVFFEKDKNDVSREDKKFQEKEIRISVPQKNLKKFKEVLLYILEKVGNKPNVGMTVIYKLLYFIDFDFYEKFEEQLIGATYIKNHYGPTPVEFKKAIEQMEKNNEVEPVKSRHFQYEQKKYMPVRKPVLDILSAKEIKHIDEVLNRLSDKTAKELSDYSHKDVPWIGTADNEVINYESVFYRTPETSVRIYNDDHL